MAKKKATRKKSNRKQPTAKKKARKRVSKGMSPTTKRTPRKSSVTLSKLPNQDLVPQDADQTVEIELSSHESSIQVQAPALGEWIRGLQPKPTGRQTETGGISILSDDMAYHKRPPAESALDAWHASFGTVTSAATAAAFNRGTMRSAEFQAEVIIGNDDRVQISPTTRYPFSCLCQLEIVTSTGRLYVGTGWLVEPSTVVTAGHCIFAHKEGGWAKEIRVYPGRDGTQKPISRSAASLHSVNGWVRDRLPAADYGAIKLDQPIQDIGTIGYQVFDDSELERYRCHVIGYPADKNRTMWGHGSKIQTVRSRTITYDTDTYGGNSGGPVLISDEGSFSSVGIHNYGDLRGNSATRITAEVFDNIENWATA